MRSLGRLFREHSEVLASTEESVPVSRSVSGAGGAAAPGVCGRGQPGLRHTACAGHGEPAGAEGSGFPAVFRLGQRP